MEPIHLFVPTFRVEETLAQIRECLDKGWTGLGYRDNTTYPMYASMRETCPRAAHASDRLISLPLHLRLTHAGVAAALRKIVSPHARRP